MALFDEPDDAGVVNAVVRRQRQVVLQSLPVPANAVNVKLDHAVAGLLQELHHTVRAILRAARQDIRRMPDIEEDAETVGADLVDRCVVEDLGSHRDPELARQIGCLPAEIDQETTLLRAFLEIPAPRRSRVEGNVPGVYRRAEAHGIQASLDPDRALGGVATGYPGVLAAHGGVHRNERQFREPFLELVEIGPGQRGAPGVRVDAPRTRRRAVKRAGIRRHAFETEAVLGPQRDGLGQRLVDAHER